MRSLKTGSLVYCSKRVQKEKLTDYIALEEAEKRVGLEKKNPNRLSKSGFLYNSLKRVFVLVEHSIRLIKRDVLYSEHL